MIIMNSETFVLMLKLLYCLLECFDAVFSFNSTFCHRCILLRDQMVSSMLAKGDEVRCER